MKKPLIVAIVLVMAVIAGAVTFYQLHVAEVDYYISEASTSTELVGINFGELNSGQTFSKTNTTTIKVENIDDPYFRFRIANEDNVSVFDELKATITVNDVHTGTIDILSGGEYSLSRFEGVHTIDVMVNGSVGLVEQNTTGGFSVICDVGVGDVTAQGTITGTIVNES